MSRFGTLRNFSIFLISIFLNVPVWAQANRTYDFSKPGWRNLNEILFGGTRLSADENNRVIDIDLLSFDRESELIDRESNRERFLDSSARLSQFTTINMSMAAYNLVYQIIRDGATTEIKTFAITNPWFKPVRNANFSMKTWKLVPLTTTMLPADAGALVKLVQAGESFFALTANAKLYIFKLRTDEGRSEMALQEVAAPKQAVQEALTQDVPGIAYNSLEHIAIAINGNALGRTAGSKIWAFNGKTAQLYKREFFWSQVRALDIKDGCERLLSIHLGNSFGTHVEAEPSAYDDKIELRGFELNSPKSNSECEQ